MANQDATKVVFLLDNNLWCENEEIRDRTVRAVRLAVLKLLTHFACVNGDVNNTINEKMRWGYRIFDSTKECQIYKKRATWLQHTNKNYKEFESHLQEAVVGRRTLEKSVSPTADRIGPERGGDPRLPRNSGVAAELGTDEVLPRSQNQLALDEEADDSSSAYALRHALQDVMNDFQWEVPDMCSPVKSFAPNRNLRRRKRADSSRLSVSNAGNQSTSSAIFPGNMPANITDGRQKHKRKEKIVFVAMECPSSLNQLEHFVGDATKLSSIPALRDTMIAKDFLTDFCGKQNASIFWLDTKLTTPSITAAHKLLNEVLSHVSGQLIPVRWLSSRSHVTSCLQAIQSAGQITNRRRASRAKDNKGKCPEEAKSEPQNDTPSIKKVAAPRSFLPLSSIVSHYMACDDQTTMGESGTGMTSGAFQAALHLGKDQDQTVLCTLHVVPMFVKDRSTTHSLKATEQQFAIHQAAPNTTNSTSDCGTNQCSTLDPNTNKHSASIPETDPHAASISETNQHVAFTQGTNQHAASISETNQHATSIPETNQHAAFTLGTNPHSTFTLETTSHLTHVPITTAPQVQLRHHTPNVAIRGRVGREDLHLGAFEAATTYSCIGYAAHDDDASHEVGSGSPRLSPWFRQAMMSLSKHRQALIVEISMGPSSLRSLGVLEPLTPGMASLRVLHPKSVLPLARSLLDSHTSFGKEFEPSLEEGCQLFSGLRKQPALGEGSTLVSKSSTGQGKEPALGEGCSQEELQQFMERSAQKILEGSKGTRKQAHSVAKLDEATPVCLVGSDEEVLEVLSLMDSHSHDTFHPSWLEPWHISAPSRSSCDQVVEQLLSIPENRPSPRLEQQNSEFDEHIKSLIVGEEGSPDPTSLPANDTAYNQLAKNVQTDLGVRQSPRLKRMLSNVQPHGRTARMIAISRAKQASRPKSSTKEPKEQVVKKKKSGTVIAQLPDFSSIEDLTTYLKQSYDDAVSKHSCALQFTQSTVALVLHFFNSREGAQDRDGEGIANMRSFVADTLLLDNKQLRERYSKKTGSPGPDDRESIEARLLEIELQTLLRLEMESSAPTDIAACKEEKKRKKEEEEGGEDEDDKDDDADDDDLPEALQDTVDEVVAMLNTVPLFASMEKLATFLSDILLANYAETIPYMLRAVYEGLMKPVPPMLMSPSSDTTGVRSVVQPLSYRSVSSGGGSHNNLGSNSNRSRAMVRHPSLADAGPKRIIGVPARKLQERKKLPSVKKKKEEQPDETKMVRRNLFLNDEPEGGKKLSRRQSVAVMETHALRRSPRKSLQSGQRILKTRVVKETPGKKQVLKSMLNKLERARKRSTSKERPTPGPSRVMVIEESPEKPNPGLVTNVRRSPRVQTLKRRPSFYGKQEMHHARLLGARIAGTSPPPIALLGASAAVKSVKEANTSSAKQSKSTEKKMAPAGFLLSQITSPEASSASFLKAPAQLVADSPSRNTRSRSGSTPAKDNPGEISSVRTTPRAKARRRLHEFLMDGSPQKAPMKVPAVSAVSPFKSPQRRVQDSSAPSPFKSPRGFGLVRQSPRRQRQAEPELEPPPAAISNTPETENEKNGEQSAVAPLSTRKRTPRKVSRKIIPEERGSDGHTELTKQESVCTGVQLGADTSEASDDTKKRNSNSTTEQSESESLCDIVDHDKDQLVKEASVAKIPQADPATVETERLWIDNIDEETQDDLNENRSGRKRRRKASGENEQSTPVSKGKPVRRDVCTPPSVPASKCTTPELINSWPRKKPRYNTPSPCSSKSLNKSPRSVEQTLRKWTSPRNKRQTPTSRSKKGVSSGSGKKRKRQSPAVGSSEKKRRRGSLGKRASPRAKGSLFNMLAAKAGMEERCVSPVFGTPSYLTKLNLSTDSAKNKNKVSEKSSKLSGNATSPQSGDSLDEWERSFSPVFDTPHSTKGNIPQVLNPEPSKTAELSITDQGLDDDTESDPEIDFPKIKSSDCSAGSLSDSEMMIIADKELEYKDMEETQRHLRSSSHENIRKPDSENKMDSANNPEGVGKSLTRRRSSKDSTNGKSKKATPGKMRSSRKRGSSDNVVDENIPDDVAFDDPLQSSTPPASPTAKTTDTRTSDADTRTGEDDENTKPQEPPQKKKKKRVTLALSLPSSLGSEQGTFQTRPSKSLRRSTVGKGWSEMKSPEQTSNSSALGDFSLAGSSLSSADDDVFEQGSASYPSPPDMASTPPAQSGKPKMVTTPLSTSGLFSLMNSPMVSSESREPRARGRSSRRNLPLN